VSDDRAGARQTSDDILQRLMRLHPKVIDLTLGRIEGLLEKLGRPQDALPPVVHVAGTNGKGSVIATMRAIAEAAGLRVHVYTSPHLVRFNERIRLAGSLIGEEALAELLAEVEWVNGADSITFFEITTAAALLAFSRVPADLCLLEVGLGGRFDATNVVDAPAAMGITPVSYDHQRFLGDDLAQIAGEKAGIIRRAGPVVAGPQPSAAEEVIRAKSDEVGAAYHAFTGSWRAGLRSGGQGETRLLYRDAAATLDLPAPALLGRHQAVNAGMAVALLRHQRAVPVPEAAIRAGLGWVRWPGRLQKLETGPLRARLPESAELWLDGGHNPAAAKALRDALSRLAGTERAVHLVVGMQAHRDRQAYLEPFAGLAASVHGIDLPGVEAPAPAAEIAACANALGMQGLVAASVASALESIAAREGETPLLVLIAGSLYLAGEVLAENGPLPA